MAKRFLGSMALGLCAATVSATAWGQLETRIPTGGANITTRKCQGGADAGKKCKADSECASGDCFDYNILDLTVNLKTVTTAGGTTTTTGWTPTTAQLTKICGYFTGYNNTLYDTTDGQFALRTVSIITDNRAPDAVLQVTSGSCSVSGTACVDTADCPAGQNCDSAGGSTDTGGWGAGGKCYLGIRSCVADPLCDVHELMHLIANVRDEYEGAVDDGIDNNGNGVIDECGENQSYSRCFGGTNDTHPCSAAADCPSGACRQITCSDPGPPAAPTSVIGSLMQCCLNNTGPELCTAANHDPNFDTEHSQCRDNRSTWDQFAREWPSVLTVPANLPTPGPTTSPTTVTCLQPSVVDRFVTIVDRSDSMNMESPARINQAVTAAQDFVSFLSTGSEFGLVSFASTDGGNPSTSDATKDFPATDGLRTLSTDADRDAARSAIGGLVSRAAGLTRIGAGLRRGLEAFSENGASPSLHSTMLLLTDGINNRPAGNAQADLESALTDVADAGVSIMVSCIGEARDSDQCAWLADRVTGRYVDSATTASVYDLFVDYASYAEGNGVVGGTINHPILSGAVVDTPVAIEQGATDLRFVLSWQDPSSTMDLAIVKPDGTVVAAGERIEGLQGQFYRIANPPSGSWTMRVTAGSVAAGERFSVRALVKNPGVNVTAGLRQHLVAWPQSFELYASVAAPFPVEGCDVRATVGKPDGTSQEVILRDSGAARDLAGSEGYYTAPFGDLTGGSGTYTFNVMVNCSAASARTILPAEGGMPPQSFPIGNTYRTVRFAGRASSVPADLPPVAVSCHDVRAECAGLTTPVELDGSCSYDPEGGALNYLWSSATGQFPDATLAKPTGLFPLGSHWANLSVTDHAGQSSASPGLARVVVADTIPPAITAPPARTIALCSPTAQQVSLTVPDASDACRTPTVTGKVVERNGVTLSTPIALTDGKATLDFASYTVEWTASDGTNQTSVLQTVDVQPALRVAVGAELADRAKITSTSGARPALVVDGTDGIKVGVEAQPGPLFSVGSVELRDRAHVWGPVKTTGSLVRGNSTIVDGTILTGVPLDISPPVPVVLPNPPRLNTPTRYVNSGQVVALSAGHYGVVAVQSSGELQLGAGTYVFDGLRLESSSKLRVNQGSGSTMVVITGEAAARGTLIQSSTRIEDFTLGYLPNNDLYLEMPFKGILLAPNARVILGTSQATTFVARASVRSLLVRPDIRLQCQ